MGLGKALISGKKQEHKPKLFGSVSSSEVGAFHVEGWVPKSSVCLSKFRENKLFGGISRDFGWDIPKARKV